MVSSGPALPQDCHLTQHVSPEPAEKLSMAVVGSDRSGPLAGMLADLFDRQPVDISTTTDEDALLCDCTEPTVLLLDGDDVLARSPLSALSETILTVNSDLYITGTVELEAIELPDVIQALAERSFHVRGYPESHHEKLPLILISRYIERLSYVNGGTHRASFQRLSRIDDERGTKNVYRKLSQVEVDTHVYGVPDWIPPRKFDLTAHCGYGSDFDSTWFVVHRSAEATAALVAVAVGPNEWLGEWTFDRDRVTAIEETVKEYL